ncbi:MAG: aminotransferase, partial [Acidimicrobiales bacterium]|nr:aminotransferase [Acidimicrobiales bacterium]
TVPDGATEIARTAVSPQTFRMGRSVGTQFHPEITVEIVDLWISMDTEELRAHGVDPAVMAARTEDEAVGNRSRSDALVDWFLAGG